MSAVAAAVLALLLSVPASPGSAATPGTAPVDPLIVEQLAATGRADLFVKMADDADTSSARALPDKAARRWRVHQVRVDHAGRSQAELRALLDARGVRYEVFWINNSLYVPAAGPELVAEIAGFPGVGFLRANHQVPLVRPVAMVPAPPGGRFAGWSIQRVNAPEVWATGNRGEGIVVANVDSGVRWTHDALVGAYRGGPGRHDYHWWDPTGAYSEPADSTGHGTHTMGTMVGDDGLGNQIGVAPGARWIAARGCEGQLCSDLSLIGAAQFLVCPTDLDGENPDCSMAPDVVNNSWAWFGGVTWYLSYIQAYVDAGIVPVFSAGNFGPACATLGSPADYPITVSVAATTSTDALTDFSSRGPRFSPSTSRIPTGRPQPDLAAPGAVVRSSTFTGDSDYAIGYGTSMSAPHVSGALALVLAAEPGLDPAAAVRKLLAGACQAVLPAPPDGEPSCGGVEWNDFPSHHYGWGRLDVAAALGLGSPCD